MCGIAGLITDQRTEYSGRLHAMIECIRYRGPDENGFYLDEDIGLGQARLSIIDPQNGKQPAFNEDASVVVIFNGEIFNYLTLRKELLSKGHCLTNHSDTAVLPHLYEEYGDGMFEKLNGQFAIAIWDKKNKRLLLARDRFGEKPLFYFCKGKTLCFASEAKAIFRSGMVSAEISPTALGHVFTFWTTIGDETVFKDIHQVPPGGTLIFENSAYIIKSYWQMNFSKDAELIRMNENDIADALEQKLVASVKNRMRSDVPISFYLSGGLDSSLIAGIAAEVSGVRLNTFSVTFDDENFDESFYQKHLSQHLGTNHHSTVFSQSQIPSILREVIYHSETPLLRSGAFPMYVLAGLVKSHQIKVVLSGEGADELFGGYDIFREVKIREFCKRVPDSEYRPALYKRINSFVNGLSRQSTGSLSFFYGGSDADVFISSHLTRWKMGAFSRQFFSPEYQKIMSEENEFSMIKEALPPAYADWTPVQRAQYLELTTLFSQYLLSSQGDRVSMSAGVECRYPFLDNDIAQFAASLPDSMKIKGLNEKYILKKLARKYVPEIIAQRRKFPYRAPISIRRLMDDQYVRSVLSGDRLKQSGIFKEEAVDRFLSAALQKTSPNERDCMLFMGILTTQVLSELFID